MNCQSIVDKYEKTCEGVVDVIQLNTPSYGGKEVNNYVKRPMNAFMVWSQRERKKIWDQNKDLHNSQISKWLGNRWNRLSDKERQPFFEEANRLRARHSLLYPNYKYRPQKKAKTDINGKQSVDTKCLKPELSSRIKCLIYNKNFKNQTKVMSKKRGTNKNKNKLNPNSNLKYRITIDKRFKQRIQSKSVPVTITQMLSTLELDDRTESRVPLDSDKPSEETIDGRPMSVHSTVSPDIIASNLQLLEECDYLLTPKINSSSSTDSLNTLSDLDEMTIDLQFEPIFPQQFSTNSMSSMSSILEDMVDITSFSSGSHLEFPDFTPEFSELLNEDLLDNSIENLIDL